MRFNILSWICADTGNIFKPPNDQSAMLKHSNQIKFVTTAKLERKSILLRTTHEL